MHVPILAPLHRQGWIFVPIFFFCALLLAFFNAYLMIVGLILTAWCAYFFRDPARMTPIKPGLVISPADGFIQSIIRVDPPAQLELEGKGWTRISVFLSVFDVHINRIPIDGHITKSIYHPGKFLHAASDKASDDNERQTLVVTHESGKSFVFVQIAGLIARRILCHVDVGQQVQAGQRYGMIRFGSRTDLYLPPGIVPLVIEGQRVLGGETVMADLNSTEEDRIGEVR